MTHSLRLSAQDEYFTHQFALPHAYVASGDPGWRERYWLSVHDVDARNFVLTTGFGKYPNRDVMDGFCIAALAGVQHNLRLARQLAPRHAEVSVGPMSVEIVDPLRTLRFRLGENASGLEYDLTWQASVPPAMEGRHFEVNRNRVSHDLVRYVQTGRVRGHIVVAGRRIEVLPERFWAVRDHSWGTRPMSPSPGDPPVESVDWNLLVFCPIQFPGFSIHLYLFESAPGRPTHLTASIMRPEGAPASDDDIRAVSHDLEWLNDAPIQTLVRGRIVLDLFSGRSMEIELTACPARAFLRGGGYGSVQGKWLGESHGEHDRYDLSDASQLPAWNAHSSDHLIEARCAGETGFGIIEYLIRRGYQRYQEAHGLPRRK